VESAPKQDGRNMIMVLGPHKKKTEAMAEAREAQAARKAGRLPQDPSDVEVEQYEQHEREQLEHDAPAQDS